MRIEEAAITQDLVFREDKPSKGEFSVGDTIEAEVISCDDKRLVLKTTEGVTLTARSIVSLTASPGNTLLLIINGQIGDVLLVEEYGKPQTSRGLLRQLSVPATEVSLKMATALMQSDLFISPEVWDKLNQALSHFSNLTPEQAVFMLEYQIPINRQNILLMNRMEQQEYSLGRQLTRLDMLLANGSMMDEGYVIVNKTSANNPELTCIPIQENALPQKDQSPERLLSERFSENQAPHNQNIEAQIPIIENVVVKGEESQDIELNNRLHDFSLLLSDVSDVSDGTTSLSSGQVLSKPSQTQSEHSVYETFSRTDPVLKTTVTQTENLQVNPNTQQSDITQPDIVTSAPRFTPTPPFSDHDPSLDETLPSRAANKMDPRSISTSAPSIVSQDTPLFYTPTESASSEQEALMWVRNEIAALFKQIRFDKGLAPDELGAKKTYRDIVNTLRQVYERVETLPVERRESVLTMTKDIAESIRFLLQLDRFATVVQFPVLLNGQRAEGELYIFKNKTGDKKIDPRNSTLFLSLTTANMGHVEVFIRVIGNNVECDFRFSNEKIVTIAKAASETLFGLLEGNGYRLTRSSFDRLEKPIKKPLAISKARDSFVRHYNFEAKI